MPCVRGIAGEIHLFQGIVLKVKELFEDWGCLRVADVFPAIGANALGLRNRRTGWIGVVSVFVEERFPPGLIFAVDKRHEVPALHGFGRSDSSERKDGGCEVDVERDLVATSARFFFICAWVEDDEGDADGVFIHEPFSGESVISEETAVIGREDDHGVVIEIESFESGEDFAHRGVGPAHGAIEDALIFLEALWVLLFGFAAIAIEGLADELGLRHPVFGVEGWRGGELDVLIGIRDLGVEIVERAVGFLEGDGEAEGLVGFAFFEKLYGTFGHDAGEKAGVFADLLAEVDALGEAIPVIETVRRKRELFVCEGRVPDGVLAKVTGAVSRLFQEGGVGLVEGFFAEGLFEVGDAMSPHVLSGEDGGAAGAANRGGDKGIVEVGATCGEAIQVGCFEVLVSLKAETVLRLIVSEEEDDVGSLVGEGYRTGG